MARKKKNNPFAGLIFGPLFIGVSVMALWQNEHRFDYHKAAQKATAVAQVEALEPGQVFSYTGGMDRGLTMEGRYVEFFTGYLTVRRQAEIYAWDKDEDSDGDTTWSLEWMSSVEQNSRNSGVQQQLSSERYLPPVYQCGDLEIDTDRIEFVDRFESLEPGSLTLSAVGRESGLEVRDRFFYLSKGESNRLGDERLSYRGFPVPAVATYFGKFGGHQAIAHQAVVRGGFVSAIIQDTGVLHHLVAGEREAALGTMKAHLQRVKQIVRAIGTAVNVFGWLFLFGAFTRFLIHLPVVGPLLQRGVALLALVLGLMVSGLTMLTGFVTSQPLLMVAILLAAGGVVFLLRKRAKKSQEALRAGVEAQVGEPLTPERVKELEFIELVRLAGVDDESNVAEAKHLHDWARHQGWDDAMVERLLQRAKVDPYAGQASGTREGGSRHHLLQLIRLALADGDLDEREMKAIRKAAKDSGYGRGEVARLIGEARAV